VEPTSSDSSPPEWFARVLSTPGRSHFVDVADCSIHYLQWGDSSKPGLLFVPASGGHAHWFDHVAPLFADQFNVVAIDLAGCGDSGRRSTYSQDLIVAEIMGVCTHSGMLEAAVPPTIVGHSAGAQFAVRAALAYDRSLLGVISIDGLRYAKLAKDHAVKALSGERAVPRPARIYADLDEAVARFRLRPEPLAPIDASYILDNIARHSFRRVEDRGWTAKFDPAQASTITLALDLTNALKDLHCRSAAIVSDHTHLADETAIAAITAASQGRTVVFTIPGTTHYPLIDSPFAFVAAIKGVALSWVQNVRFT
jgi:pimeloyl-ACP methyl ester carboxylesterase